MYIMNGIAYAGDQKPALKVSGVRPLQNNRLWVRFNTGEAKVFDFSPLLGTWNDGEIDIAPEKLYADGVAAEPLQAAN